MNVKYVLLGAFTVCFGVWGALIEATTAGELNVTAENHALFSSEKDTDNMSAPSDNRFRHEATVRAQVRQYSADVQFANDLALDPASPRTPRPFVLEKKTIAADFENWEVMLGDSHQELGRGIALALYQDEVFGINHTLEGGSVRFFPDGGELSFFGGRINTLRAPVAGRRSLFGRGR